jgi:glycosyltransferase involved in cell wall biosynthesis
VSTPKISIVTPSFNQGKFIDENIQSVLTQNYPNFEHIIIDGGSSDGTVDILKKYPHLKWVTEPDQGQASALNKGFRMATGDVIGWLNSDDSYLPGTFEVVARAFDKSLGWSVVMGDVQAMDESGRVIGLLQNKPESFRELLQFWYPGLRAFHQPGIFFSKEALNQVGLLDESLRFAMDYDLWLRMIQKYEFHRVDVIVATYRFHGASKSSLGWDSFRPEWERVSKRYVGKLSPSQQTLHFLLYAACRANIGRWLPPKVRRFVGLPKNKSKERQDSNRKLAREYYRLGLDGERNGDRAKAKEMYQKAMLMRKLSLRYHWAYLRSTMPRSRAH